MAKHPMEDALAAAEAQLKVRRDQRRLELAAPDLLAALKAAVKVADEARDEWDKAPEGMRAGKLLIALSGRLKGYRADIDAIHAAIARAEPPETKKAAGITPRSQWCRDCGGDGCIMCEGTGEAPQTKDAT